MFCDWQPSWPTRVYGAQNDLYTFQGQPKRTVPVKSTNTTRSNTGTSHVLFLLLVDLEYKRDRNGVLQ